MSKHTPGPWKVDGFFKNHVSGDNFWLSVQGNASSPFTADEILKANARLIASAPELLEQLKRLRFHMTDSYDAEETDKAIAKAEGDNA